MAELFGETPPGLAGGIVERLGCPIHYWVGGTPTKPLVAMLHGATMDHRMFNLQVASLLPTYRVLVWDARGHGHSRPLGDGFSFRLLAEDLLAVLDAIGEERAVLVGQSMGGYLAQYFYLWAPERVHALIIIGATSIGKAYRRREVYSLRASLPILKLWPYGRLVSTVAQRVSVVEAVQRYTAQTMGEIPRADFLQIWRAVTRAVDGRGRPHFSVAVPTLLLCGEDEVFPIIRREMALWGQTNSGVVYAQVPAAGHQANQDNPDFVNARILEFLQQSFG